MLHLDCLQIVPEAKTTGEKKPIKDKEGERNGKYDFWSDYQMQSEHKVVKMTESGC